MSERELPPRLRRLRRSATLREALAEVSVSRAHLIQPHFVVPGRGLRRTVESMPGIERVSCDMLLEDVLADSQAGLKMHLLFGVPDRKDSSGRLAADPEGPVPRALRLLKEQGPEDLVLFADVCLCEYTDHGHCGLVRDEDVLNDESLPVLAAAALAYAGAGADFVAPSDMLDFRVRAIREALDREGHASVGILSYAAKMASAYYGPFRDAAGSAPRFGDRRTYQMDPRNAREALREVEQDLDEGADLVMVKPGLAYLDVVRRVRELTRLPVAVYNVSGEYAMVKAAAERGFLDEEAVVKETLHAFRRAGADLILTYHARDAARRGWIP